MGHGHLAGRLQQGAPRVEVGPQNRPGIGPGEDHPVVPVPRVLEAATLCVTRCARFVTRTGGTGRCTRKHWAMELSPASDFPRGACPTACITAWCAAGIAG